MVVSRRTSGICVHDLLSSSCHVVSLLSFSRFYLFLLLIFIIIIIIFYWLHVCAKEIIYINLGEGEREGRY